MKYIHLIAIAFILNACAGAHKIEIVTNPKDTEVLISDRFVSDYKSIGKTPLVLDLKKNKVKGDFVYLSLRSKGRSSHNLVLPKKYAAGKINVNLKALESGENPAMNESVKREIASAKEQLENNYQAKIENIKYSHSTQVQGLNDQLKMSQMLSMNQARMFEQEKRRLLEEHDEKNKENMQKIFNKTFEIQNALQFKKLSKAGKALAELKSFDPPEGLFLTLEGNFEFINGRVNKALASYKRAMQIDPSNLELASIVKKLERVLK
ncbi:MAG: hypothetical protein ACRBBP_00035 [Bdellovibrionales bacterium]